MAQICNIEGEDVKRLFDVICSALGLIVLSPLLLIIAIIIVITSPGGVFFRGVRVGKEGIPFKIFKFRSMVPNAEGNGKWNVAEQDPRVTSIGRILRKTKLDELPQLINVLLGDMSLVGPRPELQVYVDMYTECEKKILMNRPGITDWASLVNISQYVGFSNAYDPDRYYLEKVRPVKLKLQLHYYEKQSFLEDIRILYWTVWKVISRSEKLPKDIMSVLADAFPTERGIIHG
ncbi:MAG: glycosyl transferase [Spirochaetae bacterium HGW-Spirochaetae-2]|jgi:lipopolysaccharide/colanic/teichoic acid biosynthesis glycosyltransferase|nr:MAG: glycosyl transferase [Spirochaetae bacterium HGW-Spirochaetae-2]